MGRRIAFLVAATALIFFAVMIVTGHLYRLATELAYAESQCNGKIFQHSIFIQHGNLMLSAKEGKGRGSSIRSIAEVSESTIGDLKRNVSIEVDELNCQVIYTFRDKQWLFKTDQGNVSLRKLVK